MSLPQTIIANVTVPPPITVRLIQKGDPGVSGLAPLLSTASGQGDALMMTLGDFVGAVPRTQHQVNAETVSVLRSGADPTGLTDSSAAFQKAFDSGAGAIFVPTGVYLINSTITMADGQLLYGSNMSMSNPGVPQATITSTMASGVCIKTGVNCAIERVRIVNSTGAPGTTMRVTPWLFTGNTATGISSPSNLILRDVSILGWRYGWNVMDSVGGSAFYSAADHCEFTYNGSAMYATGTPYNTQLTRCRFSLNNKCVEGGVTFINLKVFGGSFENYLTAFYGATEVSIYGAYFEVSDSIMTGAASVGFNMTNQSSPYPSNSQLTLNGCYIYLNNHSYFIKSNGSMNSGINSIGNKLFGSAASAASAVYAWLPDSPSQICMLGDTVDRGFQPTAKYLKSTNTSAAGVLTAGVIQHPVMPWLPSGTDGSNGLNGDNLLSGAFITAGPVLDNGFRRILNQISVDNGATTTYTFPFDLSSTFPPFSASPSAPSYTARSQYVMLKTSLTTGATLTVQLPPFTGTPAAGDLAGLVLTMTFLNNSNPLTALPTVAMQSTGVSVICPGGGNSFVPVAGVAYRWMYQPQDGKWYPI